MREYHSSIQHIVGKYSLVSGNVTDEEIDSLRVLVEELVAKVWRIYLYKYYYFFLFTSKLFTY